MAVVRLDGEGVPARARGNDLTGIFGPGFQGPSARGFDVEVPAPFAAKARLILAREVVPDEGDEWENEGEAGEGDIGDSRDRTRG